MPVQAVNQLLGPGVLYVKRTSDVDSLYRRIGSVKEATLLISKEEVEQKPGDSTVATRRDKVEEKASLKCSIVDFRMDQMINALGLSISRSQLTLTSSIRLSQEIEFGSITTTVTLSNTAKSETSIQVTSLDRGTDHVRATDFSVPDKSGVLPILAGFANTVQRVYYTSLFTSAKAIRIGGSEILQNVSIMYVHSKSNGKAIAVQFPIATVMGDLSFEFKDKDYTVPEITFAAIGDPNQAKGRQLLRIIEQQ